MPLSQVQAGMRCTGASVIRGTEVRTFNAEVLDVVDGDPAQIGPRILVSVSGPAVDATGVGPGFSGSPITCPDAAGVPRVVGAISESIGEYGGKVVLATPIESILGTQPAAPPQAKAARSTLRRARPLSRSADRERRARPPGARAGLGRPPHRPPDPRRARRPARQLPAPGAAARGGDGGRLFGGRLQRRGDRDRRLHRRRRGMGLRPSQRRRRPALAAAPGRLRLPRDQQPQRGGGDRHHVQAGGERAPAGHAVRRHARLRGGPRRGAAAHHPDGHPRDRPRHRRAPRLPDPDRRRDRPRRPDGQHGAATSSRPWRSARPPPPRSGARPRARPGPCAPA